MRIDPLALSSEKIVWVNWSKTGSPEYQPSPNLYQSSTSLLITSPIQSPGLYQPSPALYYSPPNLYQHSPSLY